MSAAEWVEHVCALPDAAARTRFVQDHRAVLDDAFAAALKEQADRFLESDVHRSLEIAGLLLLAAEVTGNQRYTTAGLLAEANARSIGGLGQYERAVALYAQAADICQTQGDLVGAARAEVGEVFSLAMLGRYDDALALGRRLLPLLEQHRQWRPLINLTLNLAIVHGRRRSDAQALAEFDRARDLVKHLNGEGRGILALVEANRAIVLRNLGQFDASIDASHIALEIQRQLGAHAAQGHVQMDLAATYMFLGRSNEALELLHEARDVFLQDGRTSDAIEAELGICYCLLQLRRFYDVLEKSQEARTLFGSAGRNREVAETAMVEAMALSGLHRIDEALEATREARRLFAGEGNDVWIARVDLEAASLYHQQGQFEQSLAMAEQSAESFRGRELIVQEAQAQLVAARNLLALGRQDSARSSVLAALAVAEAKGLPDLVYPCHYLLGLIAESQNAVDDALGHYDRSIEELEQLRGRLMVEFRADFLQDKQTIYEDIVRLCLQMDRPARGLDYAERAKSRALQDLITYRLDVSLQARTPADTALVAQLTTLRAERDRLARRSEGAQDLKQSGWTAAAGQGASTQQEIAMLERSITDLWHKLLVRNAGYARDASLWEVRAEPVQPYLPDDTMLLEYFETRGQLIAFVVTRDALQARPLGIALANVQQLVQMLQLNLKTVPRSRPEMLSNLAANANGILARLYRLLIAPVADLLAGASKLIVVPHGALHYLPFHALLDEQGYLVEQFELSYLPGASLLRFCSEPRHDSRGLLAVGHSYGGLLPYAAGEAQLIAEVFQGQTLLEQAATGQSLTRLASNFRTLHLATHGDFRPDNPLFSGLALEDGWLTTLDIFGLRLDASLVTLSACQTGRSVIGGGDELLGLMRAFLYAGAASLVLSLWPVEDRSAALLMQSFYNALAAGRPKGAALRHAQREFIHCEPGREDAAGSYAHPYFWAPFFLVGDSGSL